MNFIRIAPGYEPPAADDSMTIAAAMRGFCGRVTSAAIRFQPLLHEKASPAGAAVAMHIHRMHIAQRPPRTKMMSRSPRLHDRARGDAFDLGQFEAFHVMSRKMA